MIKNLKTKSLKAKSLKHKSLKHKNLSPKLAKGGALYTFNLTDTVGGLPLQVPLNGTRDGDCPAQADAVLIGPADVEQQLMDERHEQRC